MNDFEPMGPMPNHMIISGWLRCKTCNIMIPSGIVSMSNHWSQCSGKEFYDDLMNLFHNTNGNVTPEHIDELNKKHLTV